MADCAGGVGGRDAQAVEFFVQTPTFDLQE